MACSKEDLIRRFNALQIEGMGKVTDLNPLPGAYVNLEYTLPSGQKVKLLKDEATYYANQLHRQGRFWDDSRIYLGAQLPKGDSGRCYGLAAGEGYLLVCEYGDGGSDPEIVVYQRL